MATAVELQAIFDNVFGTNGAHLVNRERTTVKVSDFSGLENEDPIDWLKTFERAATTNK